MTHRHKGRPVPLHVGVFDKHFISEQKSMTRYQELPKDFVYFPNDDTDRVDVVMATQSCAGLVATSKHPRRVLYLQETSEAHGNHDPRKFHLYRQFDLVLSNDKRVLDALGPEKSSYSTLTGTWLSKDLSLPESKSKAVSGLYSRLNSLSGHKLRLRVAKELSPEGLIDIYGTCMDGPWTRPEPAYAPYRFNVAVENSSYPWWYTEKIFNCFVSKTVPIYWGGGEYYFRLVDLGFDIRGIEPWGGSIEYLRERLKQIHRDPDGEYAKYAPYLEHNRRVGLEHYCQEVHLGRVLRRHFNL